MRKLAVITIMSIIIFFYSFDPVAMAETLSGNDSAYNYNDTAVSLTKGSKEYPLNLEVVEKYLQEMDRQVKGYMPEFEPRKIIKNLMQGKFEVSFFDIFRGLGRYLFKEVVANSKLMGQLLILAIIAALLKNLQGAFEKGTVGKIAHAVCFLFIMTLALSTFAMAVNTGRLAIDDMVSFMHALLPLLLTLLTAMGNVASAALFHPLMIGLLNVLSTLIKNIVFPLIFFSAVLGLVTNITDKFQISNFGKLFKDLSMGLLGIFFTVFLGFMAIQGVAGSVADGVALRTAKFGIGVFVPVVGKMFSDALEAVVGTSILLKNAVGIVGVIIIFLMCALPVIKILSLVLIYRVAAALVQPLGEGQIADCLNTMGNSLVLVFAAVSTVGLMFFFVITIIVGAGNMTAMLR